MESGMGAISGIFLIQWDRGLKSYYHYEIWQVSQQHCWVIVQISKYIWRFEI